MKSFKGISPKKMLGVVAIAALSLGACNNAQKDGTPVPSDTTSTAGMSADSTNMNYNADNGRDTAAMMSTPSTDTSTSANKMNGTQPTGTKKKGKVSFVTPKKNTSPMTEDNRGYYTNTEIMPGYPGGYNSMSTYFDNNIEYPQAALDNGIEGTVDVNFAVDENGKLSSPKVVSKKLGYGLEDEALKLVAQMPTWTPGKMKGKNVKTYFTLPVKFQLEQ